MKNQFKLELPDNGFGFPCNICVYRNNDPDSCKDCYGYNKSFGVDESDLRDLLGYKKPK